MSVQASAWAWRQSGRFENPNTILTLLALAEHADPNGLCWPSRNTIAKMIGVRDKGTVTRHIKRIVEAGLVTRTERHAVDEWSKGRTTSNAYQLHMDSGMVDDPTTGPTDVPPEATQLGTPEAAVADDPPSSPATPRTVSSEPSNEPTVDPAFDEDVNRVWTHYCEVFDPPRAKLGPNRARGIQRALKEVAVEDMCSAIDGLYAYRARKPGDSSLETIWKTFRGTGSMVERIQFFISQAPQSRGGGAGHPSADRATIAQRQLDVQRGHRLAHDPEAVETAREAKAWLLEHGIETVYREADGYPIFQPVRDDRGAS